MANLRQLKQDILANGKVDGHEIETLRRELYAGGKLDRKAAEFLVELHKQVERVTPAFEQFFYQALKEYLLGDGAVDAEEAAWLRGVLTAGGQISDREKKFLRELRGEAVRVSPEFQALCDECLE